MRRAIRGFRSVTVLVGAVVLAVGVVVTEQKSSEPRPPQSSVPAATPTSFGVAFLGDSYTAGAGASNAEDGYAHILANKMCWNGSYFGAGGSGYTTGGPQGFEPFGGRVDRVIASMPQLVVLQGSTNDPGGQRTTNAAADVFSRLAEGLPGAIVVVMGPFSPKGVSPTVAASDRDSVRTAAQRAKLLFIDPIEENWLSDQRDYFAEDGIHPNERGHAKIAELLLAALRKAAIQVPGCPGQPT